MNLRQKAWVQHVLSWYNDPDIPINVARLSSTFGFALVGVLVVGCVWALIHLPAWQVNERIGTLAVKDPVRAFVLENEARKTLTQIILGVFGLLVLFFTWRRVKAGDKAVLVAEQGHITDRYTKAIEQLGKMENGVPNIEVRLGGIYSLERIARDSPRDEPTIIEVLSAYVRRNAATSESARPRTDIQAILAVLGRRSRRGHSEDLPKGPDLTGSALNGADLEDANLEGAILSQASLKLAVLVGANLRSATLHKADLESAVLIRANLASADLEAVHMQGSFLLEAILEGACLYQADLRGAHLLQARLGGSVLVNATLARASLVAAHLEGADLSEAHLEGADLSGAHFEGANGLTVDQVKAALNWETAHYDPELRHELGLPDEPPEV